MAKQPSENNHDLKGHWPLVYVKSKLSCKNWRKLNHLCMYLAREAVRFSSSCVIKYCSFCRSFMVLKVGTDRWTRSNRLLREGCSAHEVKKWVSLSISVVHIIHFLFSLGIFGLCLLPCSMISLWSDSLNLVYETRSFRFRNSKYTFFFL